VLCVTRTTTLSKHVYTFELYFLLEKLKCEIPRSVFLQNPSKILSWILDMMWGLACVVPVPKFALKLLKESVYRNYLVLLSILPR
jgi:hypothetical protein